MRSLILFLMIMLYCFVSINAEEALYTQYTAENSGLPSNYVRFLLISENGTVWCIHNNTQDYKGLVSSYNGAEWSVFEDIPSINDVVLDANDLVVATDQGMYRVSDNIVAKIDAFGDFSYSTVCVGDNHTLWMRWNNNRVLSKYENDIITSWYTEYADNNTLLGFDNDGALWLSSNGLYRYDGTRWQWFRDVSISGYGFYTVMPSKLAADKDGNVWLGSELDDPGCMYMFDGESLMHTITPQAAVGNSTITPDGAVWFFTSDFISRYHDGMVEDYIPFPVGPISSLAATDSSLWACGGGAGIMTISYDDLFSMNPERTYQLDFEVIGQLEEPVSYGDDFWYFPLHIGDTWTYDRELYDDYDIVYTDTVVNMVIDTVMVDEKICFKFLNGLTMRAGQDSLVYEEGSSTSDKRFDFRDPGNEEYIYYSIFSIDWPVTRTYEEISVPAGDFTGYSFGFGTLGGSRYKTVPGIGIAYKYIYDDIGGGEIISLRSAIIGGKTIDQILSVEDQPSAYDLSLSVYPNPFNPETTISFTLPEFGSVRISVYSITGQKIATLVNETMDAGYYEVKLKGSKLSSGVYFISLLFDGYISVKKSLLTK